MTTAKFGWLASYPKSGNTWLRMMLVSLQEGSQTIDINHLHGPGFGAGIGSYAEMDELFGIESSELMPAEIDALRPAFHAAVIANSDRDLMLRKVHDRYWLNHEGQAVFPARLSRGAIYLIRDPRDVAVSYAHHRGIGFDRVIDFMADPAATLADSKDRAKYQLPQQLGTWSDHVTSWIDQQELPVLVIRYEDLVADPALQLALIAKHLGMAAFTATIDAAVKATRFDVLQAQENSSGFRERRPGSTTLFFREGRSGGWRQQLTAAQAARVENGHRAVMCRLGYL